MTQIISFSADTDFAKGFDMDVVSRLSFSYKSCVSLFDLYLYTSVKNFFGFVILN